MMEQRLASGSFGSLVSRALAWFRDLRRRLDERDALRRLMQVAREHPITREQLRMILAHKTAQRRLVLQSFTRELRRGHATGERFIRALESLADDTMAARASELLQRG